VLGSALASGRAGSLEGPLHADCLAALFGVIQLAVAHHGGDGEVPLVLEPGDEASISVGVNRADPASSNTHLGRGIGWRGRDAQLSRPWTTNHGVPMGQEGGQDLGSLGGHQSQNLLERGHISLLVESKSVEVEVVVLLHVVHDAADELHSGAGCVFVLTFQVLEEGREAVHCMAHRHCNGVIGPMEHIDYHRPATQLSPQPHRRKWGTLCLWQ
jgi:hypothetical protein